MGFSGHAAAGAQEGLLEMLAFQMRQQAMAEEQRQSQAREAMAQQELAQRASEVEQRGQQHGELLGLRREENQQDSSDRAATRRERMNIEGLRMMERDAENARPAPVKRIPITTIGKRGEPVKQLVDETDPRLEEGIPEYREPKQGPAPREERLVQIAGPQGTAVWVRESEAVGKPAAQAARSVTGSERQTLSFFNRAKQASDDIGGMEDAMAQSGMGAQLQQQFAPNMLQTEMQQSYRQAQRAFTEARLRKESGAAIPTAEYENDARTYFAQPGDSPRVIAQKRQARQTVMDGLKFSSGKAYDEFYGDEPDSGSGNLSTIELVRDANGKLVPKGKQ